MKFPICFFAVLFPAAAWAQLAGNWAGVATHSQGAHRVVLHISGPFTAMQATANIPDQKVNAPVESITFSGSTLQFNLPAYDARYSGVLNDSGAIVGTLTQHGAETPLVLARVAGPRAVAAVPTEGLGDVKDGRYRDTLTGVEFELPPGWVMLRTDREPGNPGGVRVFADPSRNALVITVNMAKAEVSAEKIAEALAEVIPHQIAMRAGQTGQGPLHAAPNYKIRDGSVVNAYIGGHPAIQAIGEFQQGGKNFAELLAWIRSEHTRTYFMVRGTADNLPLLQPLFDQMLQSAKIP